MAISNRTLGILACSMLGLLIVRNETRFNYLESRLNRMDEIIQTSERIKYTKKDVECLTKNIYYEAGVEDRTGKYAVANVTVNRVKKGYWGNDVCSVVYAKKQFSWTLKKKLPKPDEKLWEESKSIAVDTLKGKRIRGLDQSLFYHADYIQTPKWADPTQYVVQIGRHIFYKKAKESKTYI